ncbi:MAG TPA: STAS domain-containing protein [Phycisphaerae bacterium]|nr:STAS domain-containing protein [Phycisphaerae bacterium]
MSTALTEYGNVTVLTVKDELSGDAVELFRDVVSQCVDQRKLNLVVDCSCATTMDSAALETLLDLQDKCEDDYGTVKLCGLDQTCAKILEITRLARRFEAFADLESAVKSFT